MGIELLKYTVFKKRLQCTDPYLYETLDSPWSVMEDLNRDEKDSQAISTILQVALVQPLESWDMVPSAAVGHSSGGKTAAYCMEAISQEQGWSISYFKDSVLPRIEETYPKSGMVSAGT